MKNLILSLGLVAALAFGGSVAYAASAPSPVVGCTYTATPSKIQNGVPTKVTLKYTSTNANWFMGTLFGGGITAYGTSGTQVVTISKATSYDMFAIDYASGNAHYCRVQVSSVSNVAP